MRLGLVGVGRMGAGIARRLAKSGHELVLHDQDVGQAAVANETGLSWAEDLAELVTLLGDAPRVVWLMLPAGQVTRTVMLRAAELLRPGDLIVDGGNSHFKASVEAAQILSDLDIAFVDSGTSGGVRGETEGYSLMVGGRDESVALLMPVFESLAARTDEVKAFVHCGAAGSGHYTKMIQNGIEYGMMQSLAEGFDLLHRAHLAEPDFNLDLAAVAQAWRKGSVVQSWLLDLLAEALAADASLTDFVGSVPDSGTGRWTVDTAVATATPAHVLTTALMQRFASRQDDLFANQVLSALRAGFGGHTEKQSYQTGD